MSEEALREMLETLKKQRDEHFAVYQQAVGAIGVIEHMLRSKDHLTTEELGDLVGGKVEAIEPAA